MTGKRKPTRQEFIESTVDDILVIFLDDRTVKPFKTVGTGIHITEETRQAIQKKVLAMAEYVDKERRRVAIAGD